MSLFSPGRRCGREGVAESGADASAVFHASGSAGDGAAVVGVFSRADGQQVAADASCATLFDLSYLRVPLYSQGRGGYLSELRGSQPWLSLNVRFTVPVGKWCFRVALLGLADGSTWALLRVCLCSSWLMTHLPHPQSMGMETYLRGGGMGESGRSLRSIAL